MDDVSGNLRRLEDRIVELLDVIESIAMIADGHRGSALYDDAGNNVALSVILAMSAQAIGKAERLRENGTLLAPPGSVVT